MDREPLPRQIPGKTKYLLYLFVPQSTFELWKHLCVCVCVCVWAVQQVRSKFPNQRLNLCPLQWKHGVLTTGWQGKSQKAQAFLKRRCKTAHCQLYPTTTSSLDLIGVVKSWNMTWSHLTCSICERKWLFFTLACPKEKWSNSRFSVLEVEAQNGSSSKRPRYRATWQSQHSMCQFWALILEATETAYQDLSALVRMIPGSFHIWLFMATKDLSSNRVVWHLPSK